MLGASRLRINLIQKSQRHTPQRVLCTNLPSTQINRNFVQHHPALGRPSSLRCGLSTMKVQIFAKPRLTTSFGQSPLSGKQVHTRTMHSVPVIKNPTRGFKSQLHQNLKCSLRTLATGIDTDFVNTLDHEISSAISQQAAPLKSTELKESKSKSKSTEQKESIKSKEPSTKTKPKKSTELKESTKSKEPSTKTKPQESTKLQESKSKSISKEPKITKTKKKEPKITKTKEKEPKITKKKEKEPKITKKKEKESKITKTKEKEPKITKTKKKKSEILSENLGVPARVTRKKNPEDFALTENEAEFFRKKFGIKKSSSPKSPTDKDEDNEIEFKSSELVKELEKELKKRGLEEFSNAYEVTKDFQIVLNPEKVQQRFKNRNTKTMPLASEIDPSQDIEKIRHDLFENPEPEVSEGFEFEEGETEEEREKLREIFPEYFVHNEAVRLMEANASPKKVLKKLNEAVELAPMNHELINNTGAYLLSLGKEKEAEKWFRKSLEMRPNDNPNAVYNLTHILNAQGTPEGHQEALRFFEKLSTESSSWFENDKQVWCNWGATLYYCNQFA